MAPEAAAAPYSTTSTSETSSNNSETRVPIPLPTTRTSRSPVLSDPSNSGPTSAGYSTDSSYKLESSTATISVSSPTFMSNLHDTSPENPHIYDFTEIGSATNNFLAEPYSSSSSPSWRCNLRGKDVIVFQRKSCHSIEVSQLRERSSVMCRSHHKSITQLLGVSISGDHIYFVYDFINGTNLSDCLRNPRNPNFTVLSTWMSRMQIATDLAHGLDYMHNNTELSISVVQKHIKSSSVIVTDPSFNAKICHFGAAELCGETAVESKEIGGLERSDSGEIQEDVRESPSKLKRSYSQAWKFEGVRGYMSPEFKRTGIATQKSDIYGFGVVILELMSGEEPIKYKFDQASGEYWKISVVEKARQAIEGDESAGGGEEVAGRLRMWADRRLRDSFPVDVAEKVVRVALECVHVDADKRPSMQRVAGKISKLYLESALWSDKFWGPTGFSASFAPR